MLTFVRVCALFLRQDASLRVAVSDHLWPNGEPGPTENWCAVSVAMRVSSAFRTKVACAQRWRTLHKSPANSYVNKCPWTAEASA